MGAIRPLPPGWAVLCSSPPLQELGRGKGEGWMETKVFSSFYVLHLISGGRDHLWAERHRVGQVGEVEQDAGAGPGEL